MILSYRRETALQGAL